MLSYLSLIWNSVFLSFGIFEPYYFSVVFNKHVWIKPNKFVFLKMILFYHLLNYTNNKFMIYYSFYKLTFFFLIVKIRLRDYF
jgi:hypothetical protein